MPKLLLIVVVLVCINSFACQSYSTGLQQSVARADETAATGALRTIATAQQTYSITNGGGYASFQQLCAGGFLDSRFNFEKPVLKDYVLTMETGTNADGPYFHGNAEPTGSGPQAGRHFYIDQSSVLRVNATQPASATDPVPER
jgi:Tfp pilus assembly protein PilE